MINYMMYNFAQSVVNVLHVHGPMSFSFPTISSFLNEMCLSFGSSLAGRIEAFKYHVDILKPVPVYVIDEHIFF